MNYWQVAAGEGARNYSDVFLNYGVMLMGSGNAGSIRENPGFYKQRKWGAKIVALADQVHCDDIVILKRPHRKQWRIVAVGRVTGEYEWLEQFEDVEGWDLQHSRRVEWVEANSQTLVDGLSMGTFRRVHKKEPKDLALQLLKEGEIREHKEIPPAANRIPDEYLVERLIGYGLRPADAETVIQTIRHVRRLAGWYDRSGSDLSEHEIRTFLIVPLLLALGWSEQRIKLEWKQTDVSLFKDVYKHNAQPEVILESKRMGTGLNYALAQAQKYAKNFPDCNMLVTSTGERYQLYIKSDDSKWNGTAYLNLLKLKDRHPYMPNVGGAPDLFMSLMPH